jgi:hypothetical protein
VTLYWERGRPRPQRADRRELFVLQLNRKRISFRASRSVRTGTSAFPPKWGTEFCAAIRIVPGLSFLAQYMLDCVLLAAMVPFEKQP